MQLKKINKLNYIILSLLVGLFGCSESVNTAKGQNESDENLNASENDFSIENIVKHGFKLVLNDTAFNLVKNKRDEALEKEFLFKSKTDYVEGKIVCNGKELKVKARLKGDHTDHLKGQFWSFRIKSQEKNKKIIGHNKISIQGVKTRSYLKEWVFHKLLERENVIGLQYDYTYFCVNDTLCGTYAIESHFDNHLLKLAERPKGPIFKIDEAGFWDLSYAKKLWNQDSIMRNSEILICNKKWAKKHAQITKTATSMLSEYLNGVKDASEVFDLPIWSKYIAVSEIMASPHNLRWHNLRFYFNPETEKIEPIGFDNGTWLESKKVYFLNSPETFYKNMLADSAFHKQLVIDAKRIAESSYMKTFFDKYNNQIYS
ncbi:MAG: hypothetical protein P8Q42_07400, partial [Flavobacteriales bacterium]|nr:hypothetical protein [Flavobacteriales bacterium]